MEPLFGESLLLACKHAAGTEAVNWSYNERGSTYVLYKGQWGAE